MITTLVLALLLAPRPAAPAVVPPTATARPTIPVMRAYLPALVNVPTWLIATRTPTPQPSPTVAALRPSTDAALKAALLVPGALVLPVAGEYRPHAPLRVAAGVTLDGRGAVTLRGEGLLLYQADGATIRGLAITEADGDAISINKTRGAVLENLNLSASGDGLIDITNAPVGGALYVVRDSTLHDHVKGSLIGHQATPGDAFMRVILQRVKFIRCRERVPKIHAAIVLFEDGLVADWVGAGADVQQGGHLTLVRVRFEAGKKSGTRYSTATGGTVTESGTDYVPWGGAQ